MLVREVLAAGNEHTHPEAGRSRTQLSPAPAEADLSQLKTPGSSEWLVHSARIGDQLGIMADNPLLQVVKRLGEVGWGMVSSNHNPGERGHVLDIWVDSDLALRPRHDGAKGSRPKGPDYGQAA